MSDGYAHPARYDACGSGQSTAIENVKTSTFTTPPPNNDRLGGEGYVSNVVRKLKSNARLQNLGSDGRRIPQGFLDQGYCML